MRPPLVEHIMEQGEAVDDARTRGTQAELEVQNTRLAEALRKAELRIAIEASTARILSLALTQGTLDPEPEVA